MRKLLWLGKAYFADALEACGWEEIRCAPLPGSPKRGWEELFSEMEFMPDVLVVSSGISPALLPEPEKCPVLGVLYAADPVLPSWLPAFAQAFDACMVGASVNLERLEGPFLQRDRIWWVPPFAANIWQKPETARISGDVQIVGRKGVQPLDRYFGLEFARQFPAAAHVCPDTPEAYARAHITLFPEPTESLDPVIPQAMASGACLVVPRVGKELASLFVDGEHYVGYSYGDAGDAAYRTEFLLQNPELLEYIGKTAASEIDARHRPIHRAEALTDHLCDIAMNDPRALIAARMAGSVKIREGYESAGAVERH